VIRLERTHAAHVVRLESSHNLFNDGFVAAFEAVLDEIEGKATGDPVVTIGAGKYFSNGFDLEHLGRLEGEALGQFIERSCRLLARLLVFPAPTIAAINGHAFGIGAMLALAHDQQVMREDRGWWCLPEVDLGLPFHPFMQALITARLPPRVAQEAMLTGRRYDGASARDAGIVNATASEADLLARAIELTAPWAGKKPEVIGFLKVAMHTSVTGTLAH
jgi:enoyl-CoA hydratase/carnithine racemase